MIGTIIDGKYVVKRQLGAGAMGCVYEAEHTATGRRVAVKVISAGEMTRDPQMLVRFQREARAAGAVDTQHITQVLDAGLDAQSKMPFLVMEFMAGEDLAYLIKRVGPLSPELALRITAQACLGLQKAHEAQVVHRDIKPANLFLAKRDAGEVIVKILDFGIAKVKMEQAQEVESAALTKTGSMLGSPLFMSPEQARGQKDVDQRTDIWSLGVVLYQALCGRTPYQHVPTLGQLIIAICSEWPPLVQEFAPWVPQEVAAIVHRAIRHNPNDRFASAAEMFAAIRPLLRNGWGITDDMFTPLDHSMRGVVAPRLEITAQLAAAQTNPNAAASGTAPGMTMPQGQKEASARSLSKAPFFAAAGVLMLAGVGGGAYVMTTRPAPVPTPPPTVAPTATPAPTTEASASSSSLAPPTSQDQEARRVQVVIIPPDAQAEIEGQPAQVKGGILEMSGKLGDVYRVRVFKLGRLEWLDNVVITKEGAKPLKIELSMTTVKSPGTSTAGNATTSTAAAPKPVPSGVGRKFE